MFFDMIQKHLGVKFLYGENAEIHETIPLLKSEALAALPDEWLETLKQRAIRADYILLSSVISKIREHDAALAGALARLAEDFEYDEILKFIQ